MKICKFCKRELGSVGKRREFCDNEDLCHDEYHRQKNIMGQIKMSSRGIKFAKLENSERLQKVADLLSDGREYSTREIQRGADVCAVAVIVEELRKNGFDIECTRRGKYWYYKMIGGFDIMRKLKGEKIQ